MTYRVVFEGGPLDSQIHLLSDLSETVACEYPTDIPWTPDEAEKELADPTPIAYYRLAFQRAAGDPRPHRYTFHHRSP